MSDDICPQAILETALYVDDLERAGSFYEDVVGLTLFSDEPGRHRFYRLQESMLLLFRPEATQSMSVRVGNAIIPKHGAAGPGHVAFAVTNEQLPIIRERLPRFQVPIESEIAWPTGGHSIYCRDPAGNSVEFATRNLWFRDTSD